MLIVEDEPDIAALYELCARRAGLDVRIVSTVAAALEFVEDSLDDDVPVLLDYHLGDGTSEPLMQRLRGRERVVVASIDPQARDVAARYGLSFHHKPVLFADFVRIAC